MKPLKVVALVAMMSVSAYAQERSMADATYALKGPVRSFRVEVATFVSKDGDYVEGPRVAQMEASFNQDGNRTDLRIYNDAHCSTTRTIRSRRLAPKNGNNLGRAAAVGSGRAQQRRNDIVY